MLKDKRIVILGGTSGIGLAVARRATAEGACVVVVSSSTARVQRALAELPGAQGEALNLRASGELGAWFERLGTLDHLVFTAGEELLLSPLAELDLERAREFFELRYWAALAAVQAAAPRLAQHGSIVLTGGSAGVRPPPGFLIGAGICAAMEATVRALAVELAPIRVNIVVPGFVDTSLWSNIPEPGRSQMFAAAAAKLPVGRIGKPDDLAEHYLGFMRGAYVTGQALIVDGGGVLV